MYVYIFIYTYIYIHIHIYIYALKLRSPWSSRRCLEAVCQTSEEHKGGWYENWYVFETRRENAPKTVIFAHFCVFSHIFTCFARFCASFALVCVIVARCCANCAKTCKICAETCKVSKYAKIRENHGFWRTFTPDVRADSKTYRFSCRPTFVLR